MKKLLSVAVIAALSSFSSVADESKQLFNQVSFADFPVGDNVYYVSSHYFFAPQQHSGVWDDFGYLNTDTNIQASYIKYDNVKDLAVSGEWFTTKEWFVFGGTEDIGHISDDAEIGFGYLFAEKLKLSIRHQDRKYGNDQTMLKAEYNHQINEHDYFGVTLDTESDFDTWTLSGRYFKKLSGDKFISLDVEHEKDYDFDEDYTFAVLNYYMNRNLSFGVGSYDSDLGIQAKYFFNDKFHLGGSIINFDSGEVYQLSFTAQY